MTNKKRIITGILIAIFISITILIKTNEQLLIDTVVYKYISSFLSSKATAIFKSITVFGSAIFLIILALFSWLFKNKKISLIICINLIASYLINHVLKLIIRRPRPNVLRLANEKFYSFPSGHMTVSVAFYGLLIYLVYRFVDNKCLKWILITLLSILIVLIGISRIYLGVHYFTDIVGGIVIGSAYLIVFINLFVKKYIEKGE